MNDETRKLRAILDQSEIPYKDAWMGNTSILVTCWCEESAKRIFRLFQSAGFKPRGKGLVRSLDPAADQSRRKTIRPKYIDVWRVGFVAVA